MYEFQAAGSEVVTVRSLKTIERLLIASTINAKTPFRMEGEVAFVPASDHPMIRRLAADLGRPFPAPEPAGISERRQEETALSPGPSIEIAKTDLSISHQNAMILKLIQTSRATQSVKPVRTTLPTAPPKEPVAPPISSAPSNQHNLEHPPIHPATVHWGAPLAAEAAAAPIGVSLGKATLTAFGWLVAAVVAGLISYNIWHTVVGSGVGAVASLCVTLAAGYFGGGKLREITGDRSKSMWLALGIASLVGVFMPNGVIIFVIPAGMGIFFGWRGKVIIRD